MLRLTASDESLPQVVEVLRRGGVVALPTETVYGLACCWGNAAAREKIYRLKQRPANKLLQMLAPSVASAQKEGILADSRLEKLATTFWPGALTVVAAATGEHAPSIGLRIPAHSFVLKLLRLLGEPLACTSANLSGRPAAVSPEDAVRELDGEPDLLVDGGKVSVTAGASSTVVSLLQQEPKILRQGPISLEMIESALRK